MYEKRVLGSTAVVIALLVGAICHKETSPNKEMRDKKPPVSILGIRLDKHKVAQKCPHCGRDITE